MKKFLSILFIFICTQGALNAMETPLSIAPSSTGVKGLSQLPEDLLVHTVKFFDLQTWGRFCQVVKSFKTTAHKSEILKKIVFPVVRDTLLMSATRGKTNKLKYKDDFLTYAKKYCVEESTPGLKKGELYFLIKYFGDTDLKIDEQLGTLPEEQKSFWIPQGIAWTDNLIRAYQSKADSKEILISNLSSALIKKFISSMLPFKAAKNKGMFTSNVKTLIDRTNQLKASWTNLNQLLSSPTFEAELSKEIEVNKFCLNFACPKTLLSCAVQKNLLGLAELLLQKKAAIETNYEGMAPSILHWALENNSSTDIIRLLLKHKPSLEVVYREKEPFTPLGHALNKGRLDVVGLLMAEGADLMNCKQGPTPQTALHLVAGLTKAYLEEEASSASGKLVVNPDGTISFIKTSQAPLVSPEMTSFVNLAQDLIKAGVPVDVKDREGNTPLFIAAKKDNKEMIEFLIKAGADLSVTTAVNSTLLHVAAYRGNMSLLKLVFETNKVDVNAKISDGATSLHLAAHGGQCAAAQFLIDNGADVKLVNKDGKSAMDIAKDKGKKDLVDLLEKLS